MSADGNHVVVRKTGHDFASKIVAQLAAAAGRAAPAVPAAKPAATPAARPDRWGARSSFFFFTAILHSDP